MIPAAYLDGSKFEDIFPFMSGAYGAYSDFSITAPHVSFERFSHVQMAMVERQDPRLFEAPPEGIINVQDPDISRITSGTIYGWGLDDIRREYPSEEDTQRWRTILTRAFMADLTNIASEYTVVLLIDNWERIHSSVQEWIRSRFLTAEARRALPHLVIVISGRIDPDISSAHRISPLRPFTPDDVATLISSRFGVELPEDDIRTLSEVARSDIAKVLNLVQQYLDLEQSK
jgi:hypothetical protein